MSLQLVDLLGKGYFPKELPPPFATQSFAAAVAGPNVPPPAAFLQGGGGPHFSAPCIHNLVRAGGLRRHLGIPNPVHFYRLAHEITAQWAALQACASLSPFSRTKPVVTKPGRAISPEHDLDTRALHRAALRARARFVVRTDISRFFPSIYSHSLPWALMGKAAAKAAHSARTLSSRWEDKIDLCSRSMNSNQTVGIPIGPDSSRLLAEVILGRIDFDLASRFKRLRGLRHIDDYEFSVATRSEAEDTLSYLQQLLSHFELAVNPSKTKIVELPDSLEPTWTNSIRRFRFRDVGATGQRHDLTAYFDAVFELLKRDSDEGIVKYGVARLRHENVHENNWPLLEHLFSHCILVEPACIPQVCDQVVHYVKVGLVPTKSLWSETLNRIVCERLPLGHASEAAWAMWLMKILSVRLRAQGAKAVGACEDSVAALMGLGLAALGLAPATHMAGLQRYGAASALFEDQWLLCYEGNRMGWLGAGGAVRISREARFEYINAHNVSFFDIAVRAPTPVRTAQSSSSLGGAGGGSE